MKTAIMQPYFFPYLGYFQMVNYSDVFVSYDDVDYIQRGWINRNKIKVEGLSKYFTVPVKKSSLGTKIGDVELFEFPKWRVKFLNKLMMAYKNASHFEEIYFMIEEFLNEKEYFLINDLARNSILEINKYLDISTKVIQSSDLKIDGCANKYERLELILNYCQSKEIVLPPGSLDLYSNWNPNGIVKKVMKTPSNDSFSNAKSLLDNLSIIDVLMNNSKKEVNYMISSISFV